MIQSSWMPPSDPDAPQQPQEVQLFISEEELQARVGELAYDIAQDYRNLGVTPSEPLQLIGVLKGVVPFMSDLMRAIPPDLPVTIDFMAIASYGPQTRNSGGVRVLKDLDEPVTGRHVLLVEDIVDTGLTLGYLLKLLRGRQPQSLRVCTLLDRASVRLLDLRLAYVGFEIPDQFVVGYGLDDHGLYRNLPYIGVLKRPEAQQALVDNPEI